MNDLDDCFDSIPTMAMNQSSASSDPVNMHFHFEPSPSSTQQVFPYPDTPHDQADFLQDSPPFSPTGFSVQTPANGGSPSSAILNTQLQYDLVMEVVVFKPDYDQLQPYISSVSVGSVMYPRQDEQVLKPVFRAVVAGPALDAEISLNGNINGHQSRDCKCKTEGQYWFVPSLQSCANATCQLYIPEKSVIGKTVTPQQPEQPLGLGHFVLSSNIVEVCRCLRCENRLKMSPVHNTSMPRVASLCNQTPPPQKVTQATLSESDGAYVWSISTYEKQEYQSTALTLFVPHIQCIILKKPVASMAVQQQSSTFAASAESCQLDKSLLPILTNNSTNNINQTTLSDQHTRMLAVLRPTITLSQLQSALTHASAHQWQTVPVSPIHTKDIEGRTSPRLRSLLLSSPNFNQDQLQRCSCRQCTSSKSPYQAGQLPVPLVTLLSAQVQSHSHQNTQLPPITCPIQPILLLSPASFSFLFDAQLSETPILVTSIDSSKAAAVVTALSILQYPLPFVAPYVPFLPLAQSGLNQVPTPSLLGGHRELATTAPKTMLVYNIDSDTFTVPQRSPTPLDSFTDLGVKGTYPVSSPISPVILGFSCPLEEAVLQHTDADLAFAAATAASCSKTPAIQRNIIGITGEPPSANNTPMLVIPPPLRVLMETALITAQQALEKTKDRIWQGGVIGNKTTSTSEHTHSSVRDLRFLSDLCTCSSPLFPEKQQTTRTLWLEQLISGDQIAGNAYCSGNAGCLVRALTGGNGNIKQSIKKGKKNQFHGTQLQRMAGTFVLEYIEATLFTQMMDVWAQLQFPLGLAGQHGDYDTHLHQKALPVAYRAVGARLIQSHQFSAFLEQRNRDITAYFDHRLNQLLREALHNVQMGYDSVRDIPGFILSDTNGWQPLTCSVIDDELSWTQQLDEKTPKKVCYFPLNAGSSVCGLLTWVDANQCSPWNWGQYDVPTNAQIDQKKPGWFTRKFGTVPQIIEETADQVLLKEQKRQNRWIEYTAVTEMKNLQSTNNNESKKKLEPVLQQIANDQKPGPLDAAVRKVLLRQQPAFTMQQASYLVLATSTEKKVDLIVLKFASYEAATKLQKTITVRIRPTIQPQLKCAQLATRPLEQKAPPPLSMKNSIQTVLRQSLLTQPPNSQTPHTHNVHHLNVMSTPRSIVPTTPQNLHQTLAMSKLLQDHTNTRNNDNTTPISTNSANLLHYTNSLSTQLSGNNFSTSGTLNSTTAAVTDLFSSFMTKKHHRPSISARISLASPTLQKVTDSTPKFQQAVPRKFFLSPTVSLKPREKVHNFLTSPITERVQETHSLFREEDEDKLQSP